MQFTTQLPLIWPISHSGLVWFKKKVTNRQIAYNYTGDDVKFDESNTSNLFLSIKIPRFCIIKHVFVK